MEDPLMLGDRMIASLVISPDVSAHAPPCGPRRDTTYLMNVGHRNWEFDVDWLAGQPLVGSLSRSSRCILVISPRAHTTSPPNSRPESPPLWWMDSDH
jgi:hypothetical protein